MSSYLARVADDVTTLLTAETWSLNVEAMREWVHFEDLENRLDKLRVAVVPFRLETEQAARAGQYKTVTVDIVFQFKPSQLDNAEMDKIAALVEEMLAFFESEPGRKLPNVNAQMNTLPTFPGETFLNQEFLSGYREFATVIRTSWRGLE